MTLNWEAIISSVISGILASILTGVISIWQINKKTRLDLYDKRKNIYFSVFKYARIFINRNTEQINNSDIEDDFYFASRESKNLFRKDSGIYEIIQDIKKKINYINYIEANQNKSELSMKEKLSLEDRLRDLEDAMGKYVTFH